MRPDVLVTGLGIVSAAGRGVDATAAALRAGRSGLGPLTRFSSRRCGDFPVAEVRDLTAPGAPPTARHAGQAGSPTDPRVVALARAALGDAIVDAGLGDTELSRAGLFVGTTVGGMPESESRWAELRAGRTVDAAAWRRHACADLTTTLAEALGIHGPVHTISNACASGAEAIASAATLLRNGETDVMVAGGADALCRLTLHGFASLLAIDPAGCRPFDRDRAGMSLGEGAAFLVLETARHAHARGARALARYGGSGNTCDAYHTTGPEPDGRGAEEALRAAMDDAGIAPAEIGYVNAHGTGTEDNDRAEGRALDRVFRGAPPPFSSSKRLFGHALGAAGAIEAASCVLALARRFLPGTPGFENADPRCVVTPLRETCAGSPHAVISNSFGFGGNNTVLCLLRS
jgi:3-oxoacyl-(acyl-carrier-protein) synthase